MSHPPQAIWSTLESHAVELETQGLKSLFATNNNRANELFISGPGISLDYSKNFFDQSTAQLVKNLCDQAGVLEKAQRMFKGDKINNTEARAALHTLLRAAKPYVPQLADAHSEVQNTLGRIKQISSEIRDGKWLGATGKKISSLVHIGIGGSFLGPNMVDEALASERDPNHDIRCHYVANVDAHHITQVLSELDPETTLVIIVSKTFTTLETKTNADTARAWLEKSLENIEQHLIAVSTNLKATQAFGVKAENTLPMWDWVGGRYSLWSAVGLPIAIRYGFETFTALLKGAADMDEHFLAAPPERNIPILLAFLGLFYQHCLGAESHAVLTYDHRLRLLPDHLQQLDMESSGKSVNSSGQTVDYPTGPLIWGGEGTNGQHAFHQLLHQGTRFTSIDFILCLKPNHDLTDHHDKLVASCLSQAQALMVGRSLEDLRDEPSELKRAHKQMPGNRPSNMIILETLDAAVIGALVAMYEHKVFVQAAVWEINPFDQWGVELGKELGEKILSALETESTDLDPSTQQLLKIYQEVRDLGGNHE